MTTANKNKELFIEQEGHDRSDKWFVQYTDGSHQVFKHIYGGAMELVDMVEWEKVKVEDGEIYASAC